jgi:hypothetical protein
MIDNIYAHRMPHCNKSSKENIWTEDKGNDDRMVKIYNEELQMLHS